MAEIVRLGVDKGLIKNKEVLSDLIEKKKAAEMEKILPRMRAMQKVHHIERKREEIASANDSEAKNTQESDNDTENDSEEAESNSSKKTPPSL